MIKSVKNICKGAFFLIRRKHSGRKLLLNFGEDCVTGSRVESGLIPKAGAIALLDRIFGHWNDCLKLFPLSSSSFRSRREKNPRLPSSASSPPSTTIFYSWRWSCDGLQERRQYTKHPLEDETGPLSKATFKNWQLTRFWFDFLRLQRPEFDSWHPSSLELCHLADCPHGMLVLRVTAFTTVE